MALAPAAVVTAESADKLLPCIIGGSCHKYNFCCDKCFVATNTWLRQTCLSQQNTFFVARKLCFCQVLVATKIFCCDKHKHTFCHDKRHVLSRQTPVCHDKNVFIVKNFYRNKIILVAAPTSGSLEVFSWNKPLPHRPPVAVVVVAFLS